MALLRKLMELLVILAAAHMSLSSCSQLRDSELDSSAAAADINRENGNVLRTESLTASEWRERLGKLMDILRRNEEVQQETSDRPIIYQEYPFDSEVQERRAISTDSFNQEKRFSEFLGGKRKRSLPVNSYNKRFSEFLGGKRKRYSEFLGGKKRAEQVVSQPHEYQIFQDPTSGDRYRRFSEFLGGKRSVLPSGYENPHNVLSYKQPRQLVDALL